MALRRLTNGVAGFALDRGTLAMEYAISTAAEKLGMPGAAFLNHAGFSLRPLLRGMQHT